MLIITDLIIFFFFYFSFVMNSLKHLPRPAKEAKVVYARKINIEQRAIVKYKKHKTNEEFGD